ncbi:MAG TPA: hypothetical protein VFQ35_19545, partial [Polyangiaceae bacterium]|nr:hypothetical protein [Polyangiaceae bacterium]
ACSAIGCVATSGTLSSLLFEVTPGISSDTNTTSRFFKRLDAIPFVPTATNLGSAFKQGTLALELANPVTVSGSLNAAGCSIAFSDPSGAPIKSSSNGTIPARLTFIPSERMWGLAASTVMTTTSLRESGTLADYSFEVSLPAGAYDVYVEPFPVVDMPAGQPSSCAVLPQLFRAESLNRSSSLKLALATPKHIDLKLRYAQSDQDLDGWRVDMIEPVTGRLVSNTVELELPTRTDGTLVYAVPLDYVPVWGDDPKLTHGELVRLSPPKNTDAPTLFFWREGLEWASPGEGVIDQLSAFPSAVLLSGSVSSGTVGVPASITFTANQVNGVPSGLFPSFIRSVETDEEGDFQVNLVPGTYKAIAVPRNKQGERPFALSTTTLTVPAGSPVQAGATLPVGPAFSLQGNAFTSRGEGAWGAAVNADVSPSRITTSTFERAIGELPVVPRSASATIRDGTGSYQLFTEPGVYDLSVRPPGSSRYAWLVMPGFEPALGANDTLDISFPDLRLPAPLPVELVVNWAGAKAPDPLLIAASVNAYALVDESGEPTTDARAAVSAVRIAEGRLDTDGHVTLMLPAKLERPPEGFVSVPDSQP